MLPFKRSSAYCWFLVFSFALFACKTTPKTWEGQAPIVVVPTTTLPIQKQFKTTFDLGTGIYCSNEFEGARLNGAVLTDDTLVTILITPENSPINPSPWYAFKIWANDAQAIRLKVTYQAGARHRYYPKLSRDGLNWDRVKDENYFKGPVDPEGYMPGLVPSMITEMGKSLEGYEPNIRPNKDTVRSSPTSSSFFFYEMNAESLTYELGDNTPRDHLRKKGEMSAMKLMELMLRRE